MSNPTSDFTHLWNDLPFEERKRLTPYMVETQKLHIWQCKQRAILAHKEHMRGFDDWIACIDRALEEFTLDQPEDV
jgi:hypothetical protein